MAVPPEGGEKQLQATTADEGEGRRCGQRPLLSWAAVESRCSREKAST